MGSKARVLIIGGGFGGLFTALHLAGHADVTLLSDEERFTFRPLLYEYLSGEVEEWHIAPAYQELIDERIRFVQGQATDVDLSARQVSLANDHEPLEYDVLVLAVGGLTNFAGVPGAAEHSLSFRGIEDADRLRQRMVKALIDPPDPPRTYAVPDFRRGRQRQRRRTFHQMRICSMTPSTTGLKGNPACWSSRWALELCPEWRRHPNIENALHLSRVEVHTLLASARRRNS